MADKGLSTQLKKLIASALLSATVALCTTTIPGSLSHAINRGPWSIQDQDQNSRPGATQTVTTETPDIPEQPKMPELPGEKKRDKKDKSKDNDIDQDKDKDEPEGDGTGIVRDTFSNPENIDTDRQARKRARPEHPYYFTAQYAQRYDDNVLFDQNKSKDLVSLPEFGFGFTHVTAHSLTRLDYLGGAEIYHRNSQLNGLVNSVGLAYEYDLSRRLTFTLADNFLQRPNPARFGPQVFGNGLLGNANSAGVPANAGALNTLTSSKSTFNEINTGFTYQLSKHSNLRANYDYAFTKFSNPQLINTAEHTIELGYDRQVSQRRGFDFAYQVSRFANSGGQLAHTFLPSMWYQRNPRLRLRFGIGPQFYGGLFSYAAVAEATYLATRKTNLSLSYTAGLGTGGGLAATTRNQAFFTTIDHVRGKFSTEFRFGYSRSKAVGNNNQIQLSTLVPSGFTNSELIFETQVGYAMADKTALFVDYSNSRQFGGGNNSLSRNIFSVGINFDTRRSSRQPQLRQRR